MRVLFAHNLAPWDPRSGGGQRVQHQVATALAARGHEVRALFLGADMWTPVSTRYRWHAVPEHPRLLNNVAALARATERLCAEWMPDAAFLSSPESLGVLARLPQRTGVLATSHHPSPPPLPRPGWRLGKALTEARRLQPFFYERTVLRRAHRRSAVSFYGRAVLIERGYLEPGAQVRVIHNALDDDWLQGRRPRIGPDEEDGFLFVGRMDHQKGIDLLLQAYAAARPDWPLTLIGDGADRVGLEALAGTLGLTDRVVFLGYRDRIAVRRAMERAGALVAPSRAENYPMVLLEAMAVGLPVLATRVGGVPEMIAHGESGILVEPEDVSALGEALTRMSRDSTLRQRLRVTGLHVAARHGSSPIVGALEEELQSAAHVAGGIRTLGDVRPRGGPPGMPPECDEPSKPRRTGPRVRDQQPAIAAGARET